LLFPLFMNIHTRATTAMIPTIAPAPPKKDPALKLSPVSGDAVTLLLVGVVTTAVVTIVLLAGVVFPVGVVMLPEAGVVMFPVAGVVPFPVAGVVTLEVGVDPVILALVTAGVEEEVLAEGVDALLLEMGVVALSAKAKRSSPKSKFDGAPDTDIRRHAAPTANSTAGTWFMMVRW